MAYVDSGGFPDVGSAAAAAAGSAVNPIIGIAAPIVSKLLSNGLNSLLGGDRAEDLMEQKFQYDKQLMYEQAKLNSPAHIAGEYAKAGFNPYVTMGGGSGATGGQASGAQMSIPDAMYDMMPSQIGVLGADMLYKLAGAFKSSSEGSVVRDVAGSQIFKNYAEGLSADALANLNKIEADFKKTYGDKLYQGQVSKYAAEVAELYQRANLAMAQGNLAEAEEANEQLKQVIYREQGKQEEFNAKMLAIRLKVYPDILDLEIKQKKEEVKRTKSETSRNYAEGRKATSEANYFDALAQTENDMRSGRVTGQELGNSLLSLNELMQRSKLRVQSATEQDQIRAMIETCKREGLVNAEMSAKIDKLVRENAWIEVNQMMGCLGQAISMYTGVKGLAINEWTAMQKMDISREFNRIYNSDVVNRHNYTEDVYPTGNGSFHREHFGVE